MAQDCRAVEKGAAANDSVTVVAVEVRLASIKACGSEGIWLVQPLTTAQLPAPHMKTVQIIRQIQSVRPVWITYDTLRASMQNFKICMLLVKEI